MSIVSKENTVNFSLIIYTYYMNKKSYPADKGIALLVVPACDPAEDLRGADVVELLTVSI